MERIDIDMRELARSAKRHERFRSGGLMNALAEPVTKDHVIDGQVLAFDKPVPMGDGLYYFKPYAFGKFDPEGPPIGVWIDHNKASEVCTTDDAASVVIDAAGIQIRVDVNKAKNGKLLAHICRSGNREDLSGGYTLFDVEDRVIEGQKVRIVHKARLDEVSFVKHGAAGDECFAAVVDASITPKPVAGKRSATFKANYNLHKISSKVRDLKQRIAAMAGYAPANDETFSLSRDQLNRLQTEETERLQAKARQLLNIE